VVTSYLSIVSRDEDPRMNVESDAEQTDDLPSNLGSPATQAFHEAGLVRLEQFTKVREADLRRLHGVGPKAIERLRRALADRGMAFGD
jgi:predicted flap endonuclease-1-like 5' DNA nuclease